MDKRERKKRDRTIFWYSSKEDNDEKNTIILAKFNKLQQRENNYNDLRNTKIVKCSVIVIMKITLTEMR